MDVPNFIEWRSYPGSVFWWDVFQIDANGGTAATNDVNRPATGPAPASATETRRECIKTDTLGHASRTASGSKQRHPLNGAPFKER